MESNTLFATDIDGHIYKRVSGPTDEPLYILKPYGLAGDNVKTLERMMLQVASDISSDPMLELNVKATVKGRPGNGKKSVSVKVSWLKSGNIMNLLNSIYPGETDFNTIYVSVFRPKYAHRSRQTTKELLVVATGSLKRIEARVEQQFELLLRQGLNYRQAATELGITEVEAFEMASKLMN